MPERSSEFYCQKNKNGQKKQYDADVHTSTTNFIPVKLFTFSCLSFWSFSSCFNLQKLFLMFSTTPIYPKDILRNVFVPQIFCSKKKLFIFFFMFFWIFFFDFFFFLIFFFDFFFFVFFFLIFFFFWIFFFEFFFFEFCFFDFFFLSVLFWLLVFVFFWQNKQRTL